MPELKKIPKVSFGILALNTEPFTRYCLRALYPFAHQILISEGAVPAARAVAGPDGHSSDGTLATIRRFQAEEDPQKKVILITAEDEGSADGFWTGEKDAMSQAYAKRATGDYLWQVDADEFYHAADMRRILEQLEAHPEIHAVSFKMLTFWGGFDYLTDGWYLRGGADEYHRLFRWAPGYRYATHRPPTVLDGAGQDLRAKGWWRAADSRKLGISLYHYSLLFPKQVTEKCSYYAHAPWAHRAQAETWAKEVFAELRKPFRVHNVYEYPSWLLRFRHQHPEQILALRQAIADRTVAVELRPTSDIERLLRSPRYALQKLGLQIVFEARRGLRRLRSRLARRR